VALHFTTAFSAESVSSPTGRVSRAEGDARGTDVERRRVTREGAERLGRINILRDIPVGRRRELARIADELTAEAGETLMQQGEPGFEFMMIEDGQADVIQDGVRINTMGPGDCFGELSVLADGQPRTASVIATSNLRAIVLTAHFMREVRDRMPPVGASIDGVASEREARDAARHAS
jgi:CRP-like cAMP-binding protein